MRGERARETAGGPEAVADAADAPDTPRGSEDIETENQCVNQRCVPKLIQWNFAPRDFPIDGNSLIANTEIDRKIIKGTSKHFPYRRISLPGGSLGAGFHCMWTANAPALLLLLPCSCIAPGLLMVCSCPAPDPAHPSFAAFIIIST